MNRFTLHFPGEIEKEIGLNKNEINSFKGMGCKFYGRKTCVAWVRAFLEKITATESESDPHSRLQRAFQPKVSQFRPTEYAELSRSEKARHNSRNSRQRGGCDEI